MQQLYLIGGGPAAGKSTVSETLAKKYGMTYIKTDLLEGDHRPQAAHEKYPVNNYLNSLSDDERPLELIKLSAKQEAARLEELFFMLLRELEKHEESKIILEGNMLLPHLIKEHLHGNYQAVWLLPTLKFQSQQYLQRDWAVDLIGQSDDPTMLLHTWVKRDHAFNQEVEKEVKQYGFPLLIVDGSNDLKHTTEWVERRFSLG